MLMQVLEFYAKHGLSLSRHGINEAVVPFAVSLDLLNLLQENSILVLGGDIYQKNEDAMTYSYDNWFYAGEEVSESIIVALKYLGTITEVENKYISFIV